MGKATSSLKKKKLFSSTLMILWILFLIINYKNGIKTFHLYKY